MHVPLGAAVFDIPFLCNIFLNMLYSTQCLDEELSALKTRQLPTGKGVPGHGRKVH